MLRLFNVRKVAAKETEKLRKLLMKYGITEKALQKVMKIYGEG